MTLLPLRNPFPAYEFVKESRYGRLVFCYLAGTLLMGVQSLGYALMAELLDVEMSFLRNDQKSPAASRVSGIHTIPRETIPP